MAISWQLIVGLSFILANRGDGDPPPPDQVATGDIEIARALDDYHHHWILTGQPTTAARWKPVREGARDRIDALKSGKLSGGQECTVSTTAIGPFSISFWWKASTERNNDELVFQIDGKERANISGIEDWTQVVQEVGAGPHQISWTYRKDGSIDNGDDAGWIDGVSITDRKESPVEVAKPDRNAASWPNWSVSAPALPDRRYQLWAKEDGLDWKPGSDEAKPSKGDRIEFFEPEFKAKKRQYRITLVEPPTFTKLPENELNAILGQPFAIEIETTLGEGQPAP